LKRGTANIAPVIHHILETVQDRRYKITLFIHIGSLVLAIIGIEIGDVDLPSTA